MRVQVEAEATDFLGSVSNVLNICRNESSAIRYYHRHRHHAAVLVP
jgi:hypothetical protein